MFKNGKAKFFNDVSEGIEEYTNLFIKEEDLGIEKICSGNDKITFFDIETSNRTFYPGDSFSISLKYESLVSFDGVEIDIAILSSRQFELYFQATNKAYNKEISLLKGTHVLNVKIEDIRINNAVAKIGVAIWSKNRADLLFWWRVPVKFKGVPYSTGGDFLNVLYETY